MDISIWWSGHFFIFVKMPLKPFSEDEISKTNDASDARMSGIEVCVQLYRYLKTRSSASNIL
jgi:hypothetical protein